MILSLINRSWRTALVVLLAAILVTPAAALAGPDLAHCPQTQPFDEELMERTGPIPVPREFAGLVKSDLQHFAVSTMAGRTLCIDTNGIDTIDEVKVSPDQRFLAFQWLGYEVFGYMVVDRSGNGLVTETGNAPLSPPTGRRFASVDLSESALGALNAFGVWDILPVGVRPLAQFSEGLPGGDWRIERWQGENCVELSVLPSDRQSGDGDLDKAPRDPWFAAKKNKWQPMEGACPKA